MPITLFYAGCLGLLLVLLSYRVIQARHAAGASFGDGGDKRLQRRIRGQANLTEFGPLGLVLLAGLELTGAPLLLLHALGGLFLAGRLLHGWGFGFTDHSVIGRVGGTALTLTALVLMSVAALWLAIA